MGNVLAAPAIIDVVADEEIAAGRMAAMIRREHLRDESNPLEVSDEQFRKFYWMPQHLAIQFIMILVDRDHLSVHPLGVPPHLQVLSVLRFLASGSYQAGLGHDYNHAMSQSTVSKYMRLVIPAINTLAQEHIKFPSNEEKRQETFVRFQESLGYPGAIGLMDCTLIELHTPSEHEEAYVDHHQNHSLNVQAVADLDYNIFNLRVVSGSTHDAFAWRFSDLRQEMVNLRNNYLNGLIGMNYFLVGVSGYTQAPYLMVPINDAPEGSPEFNFSSNTRRTRCRVEQCFGIWKETMRCVNSERILHYSPEFSAQIILAFAVVYNFARRHGVNFPVPAVGINLRNDQIDAAILDDDYAAGLIVRQAIINEYF